MYNSFGFVYDLYNYLNAENEHRPDSSIYEEIDGTLKQYYRLEDQLEEYQSEATYRSTILKTMNSLIEDKKHLGLIS